MQYRRLRCSGLRVSALSFGSWITFSFQVDDAAAEELTPAPSSWARPRRRLEENLAALDVVERLDGGVMERIEGILAARTPA